MFPELYQLIETAFKTAEVSDGTEQEFTNRLRSSRNYIPALALVAEENGRFIGQIMLTRFGITNGVCERPALILATVAVVKEFRSSGVGSTLVREGFTRAKALEYDAVILVGNPLYYKRFGFTEFAGFGIGHLEDIPSMYILACELVLGALAGIGGRVEFPHLTPLWPSSTGCAEEYSLASAQHNRTSVSSIQNRILNTNIRKRLQP